MITLSLGALGLLTTVLAAGTEVTLDGMKSAAPKTWKEVQTTSSMRYKQFTIPHAPGDTIDAELVIFFFGPGGGGGVDANVTRWKGMFKPPAGQTIDQASKQETTQLGSIKVTILDIHGTYLFKATPMAADSEPRPNHRMIAMVLATPNGPYFLRFVGPEKTIAQHKKDLEGWLRSFK